MKKINYKEVSVVTRCPLCGKANFVEVNEEDYWDWDDGVKVAVAFPYLSANEREMLISGICPDCWVSMLPPEPEKEDEKEVLGLLDDYAIECMEHMED